MTAKRFLFRIVLLGVLGSALFAGRLLYRFVFYPLSSSTPSSGASPFNPVTLAILFVIFGYYIFYYSGVLGRSRELAAGGT